MVTLRSLTLAGARRHAQAMVSALGKQDNEAAARVRPRPKGPTPDIALFDADF
jgi:hypothetical protein